MPDRPGPDRRYAINTSRLRRELGWSPRFPDLGTGLARTVQWYRDNEAWWRTVQASTGALYATRGQ